MSRRSDIRRGTRVWPLLLGGLLLWGMTVVPPAQAQRGRPSPADCDAYARNYARQTEAPVLGHAARGAAQGALFGAIIGGGKGAGRGAALGGLTGSIRGGVRKGQSYDWAYNECMAGRVRW
jgi:hypothetical protein